MFDIENCPAEAWNYEFIVCDARGDKLVFNSYHKSGCAAETVASHLDGGIVIHNVRIQGYHDPHPERCYTFEGTWTWSCWAHDKDEAIRKFEDEAYPEEMCIGSYDKIETSEGEV